MMIRSAPPASAHLADSPVPAPAPMTGLPSARLGPQPGQQIVASHRQSSPAAGRRWPVVRLARAVGWSVIIWCSRSAIAVANAGSLRCASDPVQGPARPRVSSGPAPPGRPRRRPASRNGWPSASSALTPRSGQNTSTGPGRRRRLAADPGAELGHLLGRGPHQRHGRVVLEEQPAAERGGHRVGRPEVHHVERAGRDDLRQARGAGRGEPVRARPTARRRPGRRPARSWSGRAPR